MTFVEGDREQRGEQMNVSAKVTYSLRILGLPPDATASEVRSAFRQLARTCHPDVVGKQGSRRFEQITGAYAFLKGLSPEELRQDKPDESLQDKATVSSSPSVFLKKWRRVLSWRQKRKSRLQEESKQQEFVAREAKERTERLREISVEKILREGEQALENFMSSAEREMLLYDTKDLHLRLSSDLVQVRHLALSRLGAAVNQEELLDSISALLQKWEIDEKTARLVALLPLSMTNRHKLAKQLTDRAVDMPNALLTYLLRLQNSQLADRELLERYLQKARPDGVALILRHWPQGPFISAPVLWSLLSCKDEVVLLPLLGMMKQRSIS
jgi:hypothetical protein